MRRLVLHSVADGFVVW